MRTGPEITKQLNNRVVIWYLMGKSKQVKQLKQNNMKKTLHSFLLLLLIVFRSANLMYGNDNKGEKIVSTFELKSLSVSKAGMLCWTSMNERGTLNFIVEQFIYNKWVKVGEISGIGTPNNNSYSVPVALCYGENKFRIGQKNYDKTTRFSTPVSYFSTKESIYLKVEGRNQTLSFSGTTYYMIYDMYGIAIKQGYGNSLDISGFTKGRYFVIFDNKAVKFEKKRVLFKNTPFSIVIP